MRDGMVEGGREIPGGIDAEVDFDEPIIQGGKYAVNVAALNVSAYLQALSDDLATLQKILKAIKPITPNRDAKLQDLRAHSSLLAEVEGGGVAVAEATG